MCVLRLFDDSEGDSTSVFHQCITQHNSVRALRHGAGAANEAAQRASQAAADERQGTERTDGRMTGAFFLSDSHDTRLNRSLQPTIITVHTIAGAVRAAFEAFEGGQPPAVARGLLQGKGTAHQSLLDDLPDGSAALAAGVGEVMWADVDREPDVAPYWGGGQEQETTGAGGGYHLLVQVSRNVAYHGRLVCCLHESQHKPQRHHACI